MRAFHEPEVTREKYQTVQFCNPVGDGSLAAVSANPTEMAPPPARRGRPRSPEVDAAILDAALRLLAAEGYARMTMDGVAAEAGASKAAIYLRYRSKADLATAALARLRESGRPEPTGDLRADLTAQLRQLRANAERVSAMALVGTCLTEEQHTPELLTLFRERTLQPRRALLREMLGAARESGRIDPDADIDAAVDLFMGAYQTRYLSGEPFGERWEERAVDALMRAVGG
jgi:AcrR family transcriptional regulator